MDIQSLLLGFLMRQSMTGYDLKKAFSISFSFFSGLSYGSIYPALRKMENAGLVSKRLEIQDGAPNRKIYTITEAGQRVFLESLKSPAAHERHKNPFLMKLFFFAHLLPEEREKIAVNYKQSIDALYKLLEEARPEVEVRADRFQLMCFQFGVRFLQDLVRNLSQVIEALEDERTDNGR